MKRHLPLSERLLGLMVPLGAWCAVLQPVLARVPTPHVWRPLAQGLLKEHA